jgi:hypothetical protein
MSSLFLGFPSLSTSNISLYFLPIVSPAPPSLHFPSIQPPNILTNPPRSLSLSPQVYFLAFSPHELKLLRLGTRYNNNKPRDPIDFKKGDTEGYKQKVEKLGGIHHNGMEAFPLFGITVVSDRPLHPLGGLGPWCSETDRATLNGPSAP